jgi:ribosomal protein S18 acetylase RimI-like enzyme
MFRVEVLTEGDWSRLKRIRLTALRESPHAFLSSFDREYAYDEEQWRAEFARGEWAVAVTDHWDVGLLGATCESAALSDERYLEYIWVSPDSRGCGVASMLLRTVLDHLRDSGVLTVWLWVLDGNERAMRLYERFGFLSTHERQPLTDKPERSEERMRLRLR